MASLEEQKDKPPPGQASAAAVSNEQATEADSDPDFDDLDDVLDQFSANAPSSSSKSKSKLQPSDSGPGRPNDISTLPIPSGPGENESEDDFIKRLTAEMSSAISQMSSSASAAGTSPEDLAKMGKELEDFTHKMEAEGVKPEDLLKAILGEETGTKVGEAAHEERERRESQTKSPEREKATSPGRDKATFEDTIRKTMERMEDSSNKATSASQQKSEEDMLADMLRALETSGGEEDGELSKMFLGMMEQLTNKDMLYEPMAELNAKFPDWLAENKSKLKTEDYGRYARQKEIVKDIIGKFEEQGYSDDDPTCREFIWERMQKMQEQGAPPEDLIQNPIPGMGGEGGPDEGCPTQ